MEEKVVIKIKKNKLIEDYKKMNFEPYYKSKDFDHHVHIGQFNDIYFQPHAIIETLIKHKIKGCYFSSTTSCINYNNEIEKNYIISHIDEEIKEVLYEAKKYDFIAKPLYWVRINRHLDFLLNNKYKQTSIMQIMDNSYYKGFKVHTKIDDWDFSKENISVLMDDICDYAMNMKLPIFIHTGVDEKENPKRFEKYFIKYANVRFVLCHIKPFDLSVDYIKNMKNIYGDTAFVNKVNIKKIEDMGLTDKILYGSDYPINKNVYNNIEEK